MNSNETILKPIIQKAIQIDRLQLFNTLDEPIPDNIKKAFTEPIDIKYIMQQLSSEIEYLKFDFNDRQMHEIDLGLKEGLDVSLYAQPEFNYMQMGEIRLGLEKNLDVSIYAKPKFNKDQMYEIRKGLKKGIDVSVYAKPEYTISQMEEIRNELEKEQEEEKEI